ncbi:MAG: IS200/IS605 family transposase [Thermoguttaceae bacterium]
MPQSLANILLHIIFSTKNRASLIPAEIEPELHPYLASICRAHGCPAHEIGSFDDHVHLACSLARTVAVSSLIEEIKCSSSKWLKTKGERYAGFSWQAGYGAFSIGQSQPDAVKKYIAGQREHHRKKTFQEEFRAFLAKYQTQYDERYVWD